MSQLLTKNIYKENALGLFLVLVHVSGFIGLLTPARNLFILLTPANLILCFFSVLYHHKNRDQYFFIYTSIIVVLGFMIEIVGVNTGWPFGVYSYGIAFGPQILGTPVVMGLNWFVLTYCGAILAYRISKSKWLNAILTGVLITVIDIIMEPVAINTQWWTWEASNVPLANYITWFICASIFARMIYHFEKNYDNKIVPWVLGVQLLFFIALRIAYWI